MWLPHFTKDKTTEQKRGGGAIKSLLSFENIFLVLIFVLVYMFNSVLTFPVIIFGKK